MMTADERNGLVHACARSVPTEARSAVRGARSAAASAAALRRTQPRAARAPRHHKEQSSFVESEAMFAVEAIIVETRTAPWLKGLRAWV